MREVYELLRLNMESSEEVAMVWLTTADMGFSLTEEDHMVISQQDLREGRTADRFLAPAISKFAIKVGKQEEHNPTLNPEEKAFCREMLALQQKWSKDCVELEDNDVSEQTKLNAGDSQKFTRTVQRKNLRWEKDSRA